MSGPKVDVAELRKQELARLMKLRQNRLSLANYINEQIRQIGEVFTACDGDSPEILGNCDKVIQLQKEYSQNLNKLLEKVKSGDETLDCKELKIECDSLIFDFKGSSEQDLKAIQSSRKNNQEYIKQQRIREQQAALKRTEIRGIASFDNLPKIESGSDVSDEQIKEQITVLENELTEFMNSDAISGTYKSSALALYQETKEIASNNFDNFKKSKRIGRLYKDFVLICDNAEKELSEMKVVYEKYCLEFFDGNAEPRTLSSFSGVSEIEQAIELERERAKGTVSRDYIKRQIDDVMRIHGYNMVQSEMLEATANGQVLYGVDDDTAIDVFVSNDNQVTMRVVGIGFDEQISATEDEKLYQQQCAFCSMHPQITKELEMRGVILKTKKHLPPDRRYNKKIATKSKSDVNKRSRAKEELRRTGLKTMHKER